MESAIRAARAFLTQMQKDFEAKEQARYDDAYQAYQARYRIVHGGTSMPGSKPNPQGLKDLPKPVRRTWAEEMKSQVTAERKKWFDGFEERERGQPVVVHPAGSRPPDLLAPDDPLSCKQLREFAKSLESSVPYSLGVKLMALVRTEYAR